jgi:hypothetical protein
MSHPSQPHIVIDEAAGEFEVGLSPEEHREVFAPARGMPTALKLALAATACWYVVWFVFSIDVSVWAGFAVFSIACILGYGLARLLLQRAVADEMRRRGELLKLSARLKKQHESNQLKGE